MDDKRIEWIRDVVVTGLAVDASLFAELLAKQEPAKLVTDWVEDGAADTSLLFFIDLGDEKDAKVRKTAWGELDGLADEERKSKEQAARSEAKRQALESKVCWLATRLSFCCAERPLVRRRSWKSKSQSTCCPRSSARCARCT
jgi:hypothetical protein